MSAPRTTWITGATSGIGRALVDELLAAGDRLVVSARSEARLEAIRDAAPGRVRVLPVDLSRPDCVADMKRRLGGLVGHLDLAILNAGTCEYVYVGNFDSRLFERVLAVNFLGTVRCIEACLDLLQRSPGRGRIACVSSAAAITGLPRAEAYGASKAALDSMFESLELDLYPLGIDVTLIRPGFVDTPLARGNDFPMPFLVPADTAAQRIVQGIEKHRARIAFPRRLVWPLRLLSALPPGLRRRVGANMVRA